MYKVIRDNSKLTKGNLEYCFDNNENINSVFHSDDPNVISNILVSELQLIQNAIAPPKRVQVSTKLAPWFDSNL